jgi:hypothetical protein
MAQGPSRLLGTLSSLRDLMMVMMLDMGKELSF